MTPLLLLKHDRNSPFPLFPSTNHIMPRLCYCSIRKLWGLSFGFTVVFIFFKVLVNISLFLQGVSGKLGEVMFLLHISATNHYYVHPKVAGAAMEALLVRRFPRPVSAEQTPSNGSVINAESHSITCTQLSCRSEPDKA